MREKGYIKFITSDSTESTVEDIMDYVKLYIDGMYDDDICVFDFKKAYLEQMDLLISANQAYNVSADKPIESIGKFSCIKTFVKRVVRKCIYWYIKDMNIQLVEFNAYTARALNSQARLIAELNRKNEELSKSLKKSENDLKNYFNEKFGQLDKPTFDDEWYLKFENNFRGSEEIIRDRLLRYIPYFDNVSHIVDIGCGRGEFLSLLDEKGINGFGVDLNTTMVKQCLDKGLCVSHEDCIKYLEAQQDESIGGIFSSQLIEHLSLSKLKHLVEIAYKKLDSNGVMILETVNPLALGVFCYGFYIDPTHIKPVHPAMLRFMAEEVGFSDTEVHFINEFPEEYHFQINENMQEDVKRGFTKLDELIYGAQDYYLLCKK